MYNRKHLGYANSVKCLMAFVTPGLSSNYLEKKKKAYFLSISIKRILFLQDLTSESSKTE